jgi:hypothetical protein
MAYAYEKSMGTEPESGVRQQPDVVGAPSTPWYLQPWFLLSALVVGVWVFPYRKLRGLVSNPHEGFGHGWVVVVRAPDGTHEIGRAESQDEANRIASEWMGRQVDLWGPYEQRVGDYGGVLSAVEAGPSRKGSRGKKIGYLGWDYAFETDLLIGPIKNLLGWGADDLITGWYDGEFVPVSKVIYETLKARGVEPYSHDNHIYAADARAAADAVAGMGRTGTAAAKVLRQAAKDGRFPEPRFDEV